MKIQETVYKMEQDLLFVSKELDELTDDNFFENLSHIKEKALELENQKEMLRNRVTDAQFAAITKNLSPITKVIKEKFDNTIKAKKIESQIILDELEIIQSRRKLTLYKR